MTSRKGAETPRVTLSCGCQSNYFGFPSEWDTETREGESAIAHGVLCERHFAEYNARPEGTAALTAAREDAERVKGERDACLQERHTLEVENGELRARAAAAEAALGREREAKEKESPEVAAKSARNEWDHLNDFKTVWNAHVDGKWHWYANSRCKYVELRVDMRDGGCIIRDRDGVRISPAELAHQYGVEPAAPAAAERE